MENSEIKPRRSVLFMPGSNARALEKAKSIAADTLVFDLEDAVAPAAKAEARVLVAAALRSGEYSNRELVVRINGIDTEWWRDDLAAVGSGEPAAILLPKVEDANALNKVSEEMVWHSTDADCEFWAMLETPRGCLYAEEIATSHDRLTTLVVGTNDLTKDLRARHVPGRAPVMHALSHALIVARATGLNILDGVYGDFNDQAGFEIECTQARDMGFDGKTLIHPSQVEAANRCFTPTQAEVEGARRMIEAFDAAMAEGKGVAALDGRMIEELHVADARRTVAMTLALRRD